MQIGPAFDRRPDRVEHVVDSELDLPVPEPDDLEADRTQIRRPIVVLDECCIPSTSTTSRFGKQAKSTT
jgi:hypothetical protein